MSLLRHFRWTSVGVLSLALTAASVLAQERGRGSGPSAGGSASALLRRFQGPETVPVEVDQAYQQLDEKSLQDIPERKPKVFQAAEPVLTKLFRADPKLLENKFVASITVLAAGLDPEDEESRQQFEKRRDIESRIRNFDNPLSEFQPLIGQQQPLFSNSYGRSTERPISEYFQLLVESCPANQRPPGDVVAFLTSADCDRDVRLRGTPIVRQSPQGKSVGYPVGGWQFTIYAPTFEAAEQRAKAILKLLDGGLSRPIQRHLLKQGQAALAEAHKYEAEVAMVNETIRTAEAQLEKPSEITPDILSQLKAQKIMVAIELSGLSARVKACDAMLAKELPPGTLASIGDMKVKAEVERVGIKEKLDQINAFISEGDNRETVKAALLKAASAKIRASDNLSRRSSTAQWNAELIALYAPLQLDGNEIKISPLEWTN